MGERGGKLLLFDIDGTLVDCAGAGMRSLVRAACLLHGAAERSWSGIVPDGMTDPLLAEQVLRLICGREPEDEREVEQVLALYGGLLEQALQDSREYRVLPGVTALLARLEEQGSGLLGLGTGNTELGARLKLRRGGLESFFRFGGYGSDSPDRASILATARKRGEALLGHPVPPRSVIVVGDTVRDVDAAQANGFFMVAVASGRTPSAVLERAGADRVLDGLADVEQVMAIIGL